MQTVATRFDPAFALRSPLFWPIAPAARRVVHASMLTFPPVERFDRVFGGSQDGSSERSSEQSSKRPTEGAEAREPPVRFVAAAPRPRRRGRRKESVDPLALYDARITLDRLVPSRQGSWHDLMNAFVWGTFPRAKSALHARQHRAIAARIEPGARTLPPSRTRELDALALLDEGGVILLPGLRPHDPRVPTPIVFGHAIYESLAMGIPPAVVAAIELAIPSVSATTSAADGARVDSGASSDSCASGARDALLAAVDEALAKAIDDGSRLRTPGELRRIDLSTHA